MKCLVSAVAVRKSHEIRSICKYHTVGDEAAEVAADNTVPCSALALIELFYVLRSE